MKYLITVIAATLFVATFTLSVPLEAKVKLTCQAGHVLSTDSNGNAICVPDQNTNAETECAAGEYLDGDGNCYSAPADVANQTCPAEQFVYGIDANGAILCAPAIPADCPCVGIAGNDFEDSSWETGTPVTIEYCDAGVFVYLERRTMTTAIGFGQSVELRLGADSPNFCFIHNTTVGSPGTRIDLTDAQTEACKSEFTTPSNVDPCVFP